MEIEVDYTPSPRDHFFISIKLGGNKYDY